MKEIIIVTLSSILINTLAVANMDNSSTSTGGFISLTKRNGTNKRPNAPSRDFLECNYGEGFLVVVVPDGVSYITVRIYDDRDEYCGFVTSDAPIVELPMLTGEYYVECTTDDGRVFCGIIEW